MDMIVFSVKIVFLLHLQFICTVFLSIVFLHWLQAIEQCYMEMLIMEKLALPCSLPSFLSIQAFTTKNDFSCKYLKMTFIRLRKFCSIPFCKSFYDEWVLKLSNSFTASIKIIVSFFSLVLLVRWITLIKFWMLNQACIAEIKCR